MSAPDPKAVEAAIALVARERAAYPVEDDSEGCAAADILVAVARAYLDAQKAEPVPDYADLFSVKDFLDEVARGMFNDDDGHGHFVTATMRKGPMYPSTSVAEYPPGTTHIAWFNK